MITETDSHIRVLHMIPFWPHHQHRAEAIVSRNSRPASKAVYEHCAHCQTSSIVMPSTFVIYCLQALLLL